MKTARWMPASILFAAMIVMLFVGSPPVVTGQSAPVPAPEVPYSPNPLVGHVWGTSNSPFAFQNESQQLAQKYVKSEKEDEKRDIRKKLVAVLDKQFDQHLQEQQKELEQLEKQVEKLKALLSKRKEAKEKIVDRRLEQLLQEADGLGWNAPSGRSAVPYIIGTAKMAPNGPLYNVPTPRGEAKK